MHDLASNPDRTAIPSQRRRGLLVVNPKARNGTRDLDDVVSRLDAAGVAVTVDTVVQPTDLSELIIRHRHDTDLVIVCGGDGTVSASARGLLATGLPLGILPMGTANDLARTLDVPTDLAAAADVIAAGKTRTIDLGRVNGHPFFNVASIGLSVELAKNLCRDTKKRWGSLGYAIAALRALTSARRFSATIVNQGRAVEVRTMQIAVGNGRHYGGGNVVAAGAAIDDGTLDLYSLEIDKLWKLALMFPSFRSGAHGAWSEVRTERCISFDVETKQPMPINADGELVSETPAHFEVIPAAVRVFVP